LPAAVRCWISLLVLASLSAISNPLPPAVGPEDDASMEGSMRLGIPEPMIFDLVRPLGAIQGEVEINSLFEVPVAGRGPVRWAPEIEYAFRTGSAIELELPMLGGGIEDFKIALQTTLPMKSTRPVTHGLQGIGEVSAHQRGWEATGMYIFGARWNRRWSTLSMAGGSRRQLNQTRQTSPVLNHSFFYKRFDRAAMGLELNTRDWRKRRAEAVVAPQVHLKISPHINLQVGAGRAWRPGEKAPIVAWRLIRQF
jgi:hypothetical protein